MKLQKLLILAGLLLASGLQAMQPLAPGLISTDYSDDSGSESDVEEFPRTVKKYPDQPLILPKKSTAEPATLLFEKEYDKPYIGGVTRAPLKDEPTLEKGILEYADKPRVYPALPKGLFIPPPSTKESDIQPGQKKALADVPSLAKQPQVYADKPFVLPTKPQESTQPVEKLSEGYKPVIIPIKAVLPVITIFKEKHAPAEVTITNNTDDVYWAVYKDQRFDLRPNQNAVIKVQLEPLVSPSVSVSTLGGRKESVRISQVAKIILTREQDRKVFDLWVNQIPGRDAGTLTTTVTLMEAKVGKPKAEPIRKQINHKVATAGSSLYFPITIDLQGKELAQSKINFSVMEE